MYAYELDLTGGAAAAAGAAVVDLDDDRFPAGGLGLAVGLGPAGGAAVAPGATDRVAHDRVEAAGAGAPTFGGGFVR